MIRALVSSLAVTGALVALASPAAAHDYIKSERGQRSAYSMGVVAEGGKTIYLAGATAAKLPADFDGQVQQIFDQIQATLATRGGKLSDIVNMTVFIKDARLGPHFTELRKAIFKDNFPASALITVSALASPDMLIEVQAVAVVK